MIFPSEEGRFVTQTSVTYSLLTLLYLIKLEIETEIENEEKIEPFLNNKLQSWQPHFGTC